MCESAWGQEMGAELTLHILCQEPETLFRTYRADLKVPGSRHVGMHPVPPHHKKQIAGFLTPPHKYAMGI